MRNKFLLVPLIVSGIVFSMTACNSTPVQGPQGEQGIQGVAGKDGVSVLSIIKTASNGNVDIYTISYSNNTTSSFSVTNGLNGEQGIQGIQGNDGHSPIITISTNGNWIVDDVDTNVSAYGVKGDKGDQGIQGEKGDKGDAGKSAYELYCYYHPEYIKNEAEWTNDVATGKLRVITIAFDTDGGNSVSDYVTDFASYVFVNEPKKNGYDFVGWSLNGSVIDINTYVFFTNCTLKALWKDSAFVNLTLDANGGFCTSYSFNLKFGESYILPTPVKEYQTFSSWTYLGEDVPLSGVWNYTHEDVTLLARWDSSKIYINLTVDEEYGFVSKTKIATVIGDKFTLPVPTSIKDGYIFQGWYLDNTKITNSDGVSFEKCSWESSITLRASFAIEIATIYDFMDLGGKYLNGNYIITNDLDFKGLGVNAIKTFAGSFDGKGHKLSNFTLSTSASYDRSNSIYGGLFQKIGYGANTSEIKNLVFENVECNESKAACGLLGESGEYNVLIENITYFNCFKRTSIDSLLIGRAGEDVENTGYSTSTKSVSTTIDIKNIKIVNSGNNMCTFGIKELSGVNKHLPPLTSKNGTYCFAYPNINIDGFEISGNSSAACGILHSVKMPDTTYYSSDGGGNINISQFRLNSNIEYGLLYAETLDQSTTNGIHFDYKNTRIEYYKQRPINIMVSSSEINAKTTVAWCGADTVCDSVNTGVTQVWGANESIRCIDCGSEPGAYGYSFDSDDNIKSSINLFPDANDKYTYYSASGTKATFSDASLINKDLFVSMLGFDSKIWNLNNIDVKNGIYPTINKNN